MIKLTKKKSKMIRKSILSTNSFNPTSTTFPTNKSLYHDIDWRTSSLQVTNTRCLVDEFKDKIDRQKPKR
jgi:hypothetical protein